MFVLPRIYGDQPVSKTSCRIFKRSPGGESADGSWSTSTSTGVVLAWTLTSENASFGVCANGWSHHLTSDPKRCLLFENACEMVACLRGIMKAVSMPSRTATLFVIGGLWGSTEISGSCSISSDKYSPISLSLSLSLPPSLSHTHAHTHCVRGEYVRDNVRAGGLFWQMTEAHIDRVRRLRSIMAREIFRRYSEDESTCTIQLEGWENDEIRKAGWRFQHLSNRSEFVFATEWPLSLPLWQAFQLLFQKWWVYIGEGFRVFSKNVLCLGWLAGESGHACTCACTILR